MSERPIPEEELRKEERELALVLMRRDSTLFGLILADDYIVTTSDGNLVNKAQAMADSGSPDLAVDSCEDDQIGHPLTYARARCTQSCPWRSTIMAEVALVLAVE
jgi:hypothetical protein